MTGIVLEKECVSSESEETHVRSSDPKQKKKKRKNCWILNGNIFEIVEEGNELEERTMINYASTLFKL